LGRFLSGRWAIGAAVTSLVVSLTASVAPATAFGDAPRPARTKYVALGDSFAASPLTGLPASKPLGCGRTQNSYPRQVAAALGVDEFVDASCGGATTDDFWTRQVVVGGTNIPQLDAVTPDTTLVTIGIGGNDAGLIGWVGWCARLNLAESPCVDQYMPGDIDPLSRRIARVAPRINRILEAINLKAPNVRILVVGYPTVIPAKGAGCFPQLPISQADVEYLRGIQAYLNSTLEFIAKYRGETFVDTYTTSSDHDVCQMLGVKWIEGLVPDSPAASLHPNAMGQHAMAADVLAALGIY
jgi:hypothetical protein